MLHKLKAMCDSSPGEDPMANHAIWITRFGLILRATSLDKL
jgi:lipopolysaccharide/colanic/teichoic acid biosynthesis glycosyltransferase